MKVKYETTIYSKKYPFGHDKVVTVNGEEVGKPDYLEGYYNGFIFIKTKSDIIHIIEVDRIIEVN